MSGPLLDFDPRSARADHRESGDTRPEPGVLEQVAAGARVEADRVEDVQSLRRAEAYRPLIEALVERGVDRRSLHHGAPGLFGVGPELLGMPDYTAIWREAKRAGLEGLPDERDAFETQALRRNGGRDRDQDLLSRGDGAIDAAAGFAGAMAGSMRDPVNAYSMFIPGAGSSATLGRKMLVDGVVNGVVEGVQAIDAGDRYAALGEDYGARDAAFDIAAAFGGGALLRGGLEVAPDVGRAIDARAYRAAQPLRDAVDAQLGDRDLARAFSRMVPDNVRTPEQVAAIDVLARQADIDDASPYVRTYDALDQHRVKLEQAAAAVEEGRIAGEVEIEEAVGALGQGGERFAIRASGAPGQVAARLSEAGYSDAVVAGFLGNFEVEGGYGGALGDGGTASGIAQWRLDRRENFRRQYGKDPHEASAAEQAAFVVWEMENPGAAGMTRAQRDEILAAGSPEEAARLIDKYYERSNGKHRARREEAARGFIDGATPAGATLPAIRPEAIAQEQPQVMAGDTAVPIARFDSGDIAVDAQLMQFKSGGDEFGVTERLKGIEEWDPIAAGMVTVWEGADGRRLIADGHQRLGLARRIAAANGQEIQLNAFVLREVDGFSAVDARVATALKNIGEGTGSAADAAKVFRDVGLDADEIRRRLPPRSALVRDGKALARLDDEAFGAVINEVVPENYGAAIGALVDDPGLHMAMVRILAETDPPNRLQAEAIIRQAREAGFTRETQDSLFGSEELVTGLFAHRAKLLDRGLKELRKLKGAFQVAVRNAETLDDAGNRIDVAASESAAAANARALDLVNRLALRKGNAINEALDQAARRLAEGEPLSRVLRDFVASVRELDLDDIAGKAGRAGEPGEGAGGSGRAGEPAGPDRDAGQAELSPRERDDAAASGASRGPIIQNDVAPRFDEPDGDGVRATSESVWHDVEAQQDFAAPTAEQRRTALERQTEGRQKATAPQRAAGDDGGLFDTQDTTGNLFDLDDGKGPRSVADIRGEIDGDRAAIEAIRQCLK